MEEQQQTQTQEPKKVKPIWKKWWFWVIAIFTFFVVISMSGKDEEKQVEEGIKVEKEKIVEEELPTPEVEATWQEVASWQGTGIKKTEPFLITGDRWRVKWAIEDTTGFGASYMGISVYKRGGSLPLDMLANATGTASDVSYVYRTGEFYLDINSANGNWTIIVEELK